MNMMTTEQLINAAVEDCAKPVTIAGVTLPKGNGSATAGRFQVYVVQVDRGRAGHRAHQRITFYLDGKRVSRAVFEAEMALLGDKQTL